MREETLKELKKYMLKEIAEEKEKTIKNLELSANRFKDAVEKIQQNTLESLDMFNEFRGTPVDMYLRSEGNIWVLPVDLRKQKYEWSTDLSLPDGRYERISLEGGHKYKILVVAIKEE